MCAVILTAIVSGCTGPSTTPTPSVAPKSITITDSNGNNVTLPATANRILVTNSDAAEVLIAIGAKDKIVGITDTVQKNQLLAPILRNVTSVGIWDNPSVEKIAELKPDVVITYASWKPKNVDQFNAANITFVSLDCYKLNTLSSDIRALGTIAGEEQNATAYAQFVDDNIKLVKDRTANLTDGQKPHVYWEQNSALSSAGNGSGGDDLIKAAGGINIAGNQSGTYPKVSAEWVTQQKPEIILKTTGYETTQANMSSVISALANRTDLAISPAVANKKVYVMKTSIAFGPKGVIGLVYTAKIIHPELFSDVDPNAAFNQYASRFVPGANITSIYPIPA
jgi:iron complex transport system substrate-binding protein